MTPDERTPQSLVVEVSTPAGHALRRYELAIREESQPDAAQCVGDILEQHADPFKRTSLREPAFPPDEITDAAMCIWEAMLEQIKGAADVPRLKAFDDAWTGNGAVHMRRQAAGLAERALIVYGRLPDEVRDAVAFDWDYIPAFLEQVEWVDGVAILDTVFATVRIQKVLQAKLAA